MSATDARQALIHRYAAVTARTPVGLTDTLAVLAHPDVLPFTADWLASVQDSLEPAERIERDAARLAHPTGAAALSGELAALSAEPAVSVPDRFPQHQLGDVIVYADPDMAGPANFAVCLECGARPNDPLEGLPLDAVLRFAVSHECPAGPVPAPDPGLLTGAEHEVIDLLGQAASSYAVNVVGFHPADRANDIAEFCSRIHDLQSRVMGHAAARAYPHRYRLAGGDPPGGSS